MNRRATLSSVRACAACSPALVKRGLCAKDPSTARDRPSEAASVRGPFSGENPLRAAPRHRSLYRRCVPVVLEEALRKADDRISSSPVRVATARPGRPRSKHATQQPATGAVPSTARRAENGEVERNQAVVAQQAPKRGWPASGLVPWPARHSSVPVARSRNIGRGAASPRRPQCRSAGVRRRRGR